MDARVFGGVIGRDHTESRPWWPAEPRPPAGTPNVLMVVLDDVGFAQLGCFGSDLHTPVLDGLAAAGLRYRNFHTTSLCSPTRACLLTGRNHHSNGMGRVIELATGFPGYDARLPRANGTLPEVLVPHGFAAYAVGKWHLAPEQDIHLAAPRHRWPLGRGFERFYGFMEGETHQYGPALVHDNHFVQAPVTDGYHLTEDLVDRAVEFVADLRAVDPDKPFFLYFAPGACHSPHQVPAEWSDRYRGRFDRGWDVWRQETLARQLAAGVLPAGTELSPRSDWVPPWDSLTPDQQRLYARYMEVFAGFLSHTDHHLGRLFAFLAETGDLDNTLTLVLSDNGASSEGGPTGSVNDGRLWNFVTTSLDEQLARIDELGGPRLHNNYPWGWTLAGNTPFKRWKREVHEGGVADPLIVHWPRGLADPGAVRPQYVHVVDVVPTVLEVLGLEAPTHVDGVEQRPIEGVSFADTLADAAAPSRHRTQYYEMFGSRAIYHDGWKAVTYHPMMAAEPTFEQDRWELYDVEHDPSECHDLAGQRPDLLRELVDRWWVEAARYQVLPLDNRPFSDLVRERPTGLPDRDTYVYWPGTGMVPEHAAANVHNRTHTVTAHVEVHEGPVQGVLLGMGNVLGGWSLFVADGELRYVHNHLGLREDRLCAPLTLAPGRHTLAFRFARTGDHRGETALLVDGAVVADGRIEQFTSMRFSLTGAGLTCGYSDPVPVCADYLAPFAFAGGTLHRVTVEFEGPAYVDPTWEAVIAITRQ